MPTGYTAGVADGTITDFSEYAMRCARAFGACIMLRDEPVSAEIPEFEPSDHHAKALDQAKSQLDALQKMNDTAQRRLWAKERANAAIVTRKRLGEIANQQSRYESMLERAKAYNAPTPDHEKFAEFLVIQLEESIKFDCDTSYYEEQAEPDSFEVWRDSKIDKLNWSIDYHAKKHAAEVLRTKERNEWVRMLKVSLGVSCQQEAPNAE